MLKSLEMLGVKHEFFITFVRGIRAALAQLLQLACDRGIEAENLRRLLLDELKQRLPGFLSQQLVFPADQGVHAVVHIQLTTIAQDPVQMDERHLPCPELDLREFDLRDGYPVEKIRRDRLEMTALPGKFLDLVQGRPVTQLGGAPLYSRPFLVHVTINKEIAPDTQQDEAKNRAKHSQLAPPRQADGQLLPFAAGCPLRTGGLLRRILYGRLSCCRFSSLHCRHSRRPLAVNLPNLEPGIAKTKLVTGTKLLPLDPD